MWYPSLDVAYLSFNDDDDCEINGDLNKLDEQLPEQRMPDICSNNASRFRGLSR